MAAAPPVVAAPLAVAAPPAPVQGPRSYREYYDDADNDPYAGQYGAVVARFSTTAAPAVNPQDLAAEVYASTGAPSAFLVLCRPAYDPVPQDDVIPPHSDIGTVIWSTNYFNQTNPLRVYTQDTHDQLLAADPALDMVGPADPADAATMEVRRVRHCTYVPPNKLVKTQHLFMGTPRYHQWYVPEIVNHRRQILFRDLPALSVLVVGQGAQLIAGAIGTVVDQQHQFWDADEERRANTDTKSPDSFLGAAVQSLLRVAQVATAANLPPLWQELAKANKRQCRMVLQCTLDEALQLVIPGGGRSHVITPSLAKKVCDLEFRMTNPEDLATGIQPFVLVQTTPTEHQAAQTLVDSYDTVMAGAAASLTDAQQLIAHDMAVLPRTSVQARTCLTYWRALLWITLGPNHQWMMALGAFLAQYLARENEIELVLPRDSQQRSLIPVLMVRWLQLPRWEDWLQTQWNSMINVPIPNVLELFSHLRISFAWEPPIPAQYLSRRPPPITDVPLVPDAVPPRVLEAATGGSGVPLMPGAAFALQVVIRNTNYVEADFGAFFLILPVRIRDLLARQSATPLPISAYDSAANRTNQREPVRMCHSFHVNGVCNDRCRRACDHQLLTAEKRAELLAWCTAHYAAAS